MYLQYLVLASVIISLALTVIILAKVNKNHDENYAFLFPEPDMRNLKGSIDCAYALDGGNTAYCNDWLDSYRKGELCQTDDGCHPNSFGKIR